MQKTLKTKSYKQIKILTMNSEVNGGCQHLHILNDIYISFNILALTEPNRSLKMSAVYCKLKQVRRLSESVVLEMVLLLEVIIQASRVYM